MAHSIHGVHDLHDLHDDPRNADIRSWVGGALKPRNEAEVSVFDSGFLLGDGAWTCA